MKKLVIVLLVILSIFASNSAAQAADWIWVCNSKEGDPFYIDASDIELQEDNLTYWIKHDFAEPFKHDYIKTYIIKIEYTISSNTYCPAQAITYYENREPKTFKSNQRLELPILGPVSDTTGAAFYTFLANQDWVYVDETVAFYKPVRSDDYTFFCLKFKSKNKDTFSYSFVVYNAKRQSALTLIETSQAPESSKNSRYYFYYLANIGYQPTNEDTPFNNAVKKAIAKINETID